MTTALIDVSNIVMTIRHGQLPKDKKNTDYGAQLIFQESVKLICDCAKRYGATSVLHAMEGRDNWRKRFYPSYKANREIETDIFYPEIKQAGQWLEEFFRDYTNHSVIQVEGAEADDIIAVAVQSNPEQRFAIISADRDFTQLLRDNVRLYSPAQSKEREQEEDPEFSLFLKCIRGDRSDNIPSAYKGVREKKLREAWDEEPQVKMKNIMETTFSDDDDQNDKVSTYYNRNRTLIDLAQQPQEIRNNIASAIEDIANGQTNYNFVGAMKYLKGIDLPEFGQELEKYTSTLRLK